MVVPDGDEVDDVDSGEKNLQMIKGETWVKDLIGIPTCKFNFFEIIHLDVLNYCCQL